MDTVRDVDPSQLQTLERLQAEGVTYALAAWVDVLGRPKSKVVPIAHLPEMMAGSERFTPRGTGRLGSMNPEEPECVALPDPATLTVLPWDRRFAWTAADLLSDGKTPWDLCPRSALKRQVAAAADLGFAMDVGIESEFYVYDQSAWSEERRLRPMHNTGGLEPTPLYDLEASLDAMPFLDQLVSYMDELGFGVYSFDHEGGNGQFEFDFAHAPALETADRLLLFRLMARQVAKQHGLLATFMPKPVTGGWGSGAHFNFSLVSTENGDNAFRDGANTWTPVAHHFIAGVLKHARALAALGNPTVNSYKRLAPRLRDGQISWAPIYAAYGDNNRSCMLRLPHNRPALENRAVDSAANIYLVSAFTLAAGLEGIREGLEPGPMAEDIVYERVERERSDRRLPRTLLEAVDAFDDDPLTRQVFSEDFVQEYVAMKYAEWEDYHFEVTDWELQRYLTDL